jgi:hypothetical protein
VVTVSCCDRPKLLFDVVCTLTDLDYVVYHGTFDTDGDHAQQVRLLAVSFSIDPQRFFGEAGWGYTFGALDLYPPEFSCANLGPLLPNSPSSVVLGLECLS